MEETEDQKRQRELFAILESEISPDASKARKRAEELFVASLETAVLTIVEMMRNGPKPEIRLRAALAVIDRGLGRLVPDSNKVGHDNPLRSFVDDVSYER